MWCRRESIVCVHENLQSKHKSGQQAKFLEQPSREKKNEIIKIIVGKRI